MTSNPELDAIREKEQSAFYRKQEAFKVYQDAKDRLNNAYNAMMSAWEVRTITCDNMNREYEKMQKSNERFREIWDNYSHLRDVNNYCIELLRREADLEHQMMKQCFEQASYAYEYGDKSEAPIFSAAAQDHKERRDELNAEISVLIQEIHDAKTNAERRAPKTSGLAFHRAKEIFENAKSRHESAVAKFKLLKAEHSRCKAEFDLAHAEHLRLKELIQHERR